MAKIVVETDKKYQIVSLTIEKSFLKWRHLNIKAQIDTPLARLVVVEESRKEQSGNLYT
jgi:hypothetical protein